MTDCFGYSTGHLQQWEWNCYGVNSWSESHIPRDIGGSILMDGMSIHDNLFSSESLTLAPIVKAPSLCVMVLLPPSSAGDGSGTPRSSKVCQGLRLPPALHTPKPAPKPPCSPRSAHLPRICCSLLCLASLGSFTVVGCLALKTLSIKKLLEPLKYSIRAPCSAD